jgi:hypothetical protein
MIKIANLGNHSGRNIQRENTVEYIEEAIALGYDVKIDVWLIDTQWYIGHDFPTEKIDLLFMERPRIWANCKNLIGYVSLYNNPKTHVFWHNKDEFVFTSKGIKWANVGVETTDGVIYMPEDSIDICHKLSKKSFEPLGICSNAFNHLWLN